MGRGGVAVTWGGGDDAKGDPGAPPLGASGARRACVGCADATLPLRKTDGDGGDCGDDGAGDDGLGDGDRDMVDARPCGRVGCEVRRVVSALAIGARECRKGACTADDEP